MKFKTIILLILMLLVALFSVQNAAVITVRFLVWEFALSQALVILVAASCGAVFGLVAGAMSGRRPPAEPVVAPSTPPPDGP